MMTRCALVLLLVAGSAAAKPSRQAVERLLAGYEPRTTADDLRRLGAGTDERLIEIATDPGSSPIRRNRAIVGLGAVPSVAGRDFLLSVLDAKRQATRGMGVLDLLACLHGLAAFGPESEPWIRPLLAHPSADVRRVATDSLGRLRSR